MYPVRGNPYVMECISSFESFLSLPSIFIPAGTNHQDWLNFISLDFGVRVVVMISSSFGMLLSLLTIDNCPWISNDSRQHSKQEMTRNSLYLNLAVVLEFLNAILMDQLFFSSI
jgi:hypothetical protein